MNSSPDDVPHGAASADPSPARTPPEKGPVGTVRLATAECWRLLEGSQFGRLAVSDAHGRPDIFPVNFVAFEGRIYLRTSAGTKLSRIAINPSVALEIDGEEGETRWSVVVHGAAQATRDETELEASGAARLTPWSPGHKPFVIRITPDSVTGRRFGKKRPSRSGAVRPAGNALPSAPTSPAIEAERGAPAERARRPDPIPHRHPVQDGHP